MQIAEGCLAVLLVAMLANSRHVLDLIRSGIGLTGPASGTLGLIAPSFAGSLRTGSATPQEVANAVAFLASSTASFTTGTALHVDGSLTRDVQF